jgi:hypothetical protein
MIVPSLLKRWKRLESGFDASAKAFKGLNEHYDGRTEKWLEEDKAAQDNRDTNPSSMDIYDTVKQNGM